MKAKDLIKALEKMPPDHEVIVLASWDGCFDIHRVRVVLEDKLVPKYMPGPYVQLDCEPI